MKIRRAEEKDIERILELLIQVDMVHHRGRPDLFKGPASKYTAEELKELLVERKRPIFVGVDTEDRVLGYAFCILEEFRNDNNRTDVRTLYIDDLCVDEELRGQHIGRQLLDYVFQFAREEGCYNVTLNVWSCNEEAIRFYEACGLRPQKIGMEQIL